MKKFFILFILLTFALFSAAACGSKDNNATGTLENQTDEKVNMPVETATESAREKPMPPERPLPSASSSAIPDTIEDFSYYLDERIPKEVRDIVIENRRHLFVNTNPEIIENPGKYMALDYDEAIDDYIVETLKNADNIPLENTRLSFETIEKDLDFLFAYLKYSYGAYQYYGGDEVFLPMKETILAELKDKNGNRVYSNVYADTLYKHISEAIIDCHFAIGNESLAKTQSHRYFVYSTDYFFDLKEDVFCTEIDGLDYELISIDGLAPIDLMKPYLNAEGFMVWVAGYPSKKGLSKDFRPIVLYNEETGKVIETEIFLISHFSNGTNTGPMYNEYELNGISIVESRTCTPSPDAGDMFKVMSDAAVALKDKNIIVVDLRDNGGGNTGYPRAWLSGLLDTNFDNMRGVYAQRRTKTTYHIHGQRWGRSLEEFLATDSHKSWAGPSIDAAKAYENKDRVFIVLADNNTGSSGEGFVDYLRQIENTIVFGTNTGGAFSTGNIAAINLPYSKIRIQCGHALHLEPDLTTIEGIGIQPDIWVPSKDSLERVVKFIENYGLSQ